MPTESASRRRFLGLAALAPLAGLAARSAQAAETAACYDPAALPRAQKSMRRSLGYEEKSTDAKRQCRLCAFYTGTKDACGTCQMLSGGPVNAGGVCNSFAAKAA
jgi:uncharacterized protein (DUF1501 family)